MNALLKKLENLNQPVTVPIRVETNAINDNCFYNVINKVAKDKGQIIYGWKLHKTAILEEAERHAVWKSSNGELIDVTPVKNNDKKILFIEEDKGWIFKGEYTDNVRVNTTGNPLVDDYILLSETITKLWQIGKRKSDLEIEMLKPLVITIEFLNEDKIQREKYIYAGCNLDSDCYCGEPIQYKDCHGLNLKNIYNSLMSAAIGIVGEY